MVIREWRGRTHTNRAGEYPTHFRTKVVPELRNVPGFIGATLSKRGEVNGSSSWCSPVGNRSTRSGLSPAPISSERWSSPGLSPP